MKIPLIKKKKSLPELWKMANDPRTNIRFELFKYIDRGLPVEIMEHLARDPFVPIAEALAFKPKLPLLVQLALTTHSSWRVRQALARNVLAISSVLEVLIADSEIVVKLNPDTQEAVIEESVIKTAFENPALSSSFIDSLDFSKHPSFNHLLYNPSLSNKQILRLLNYYTRDIAPKPFERLTPQLFLSSFQIGGYWIQRILLRKKSFLKLLPLRTQEDKFPEKSDWLSKDPNVSLVSEISSLPSLTDRFGRTYHSYNEKELSAYLHEIPTLRPMRQATGFLLPNNKKWVLINNNNDNGWLELPQSFDGVGTIFYNNKQDLLLKFPISFGDKKKREFISFWEKDQNALLSYAWPENFSPVKPPATVKKAKLLFVVLHDYSFYGFYGTPEKNQVIAISRLQKLQTLDKIQSFTSLKPLTIDELPFRFIPMLESIVRDKLSRGMYL